MAGDPADVVDVAGEYGHRTWRTHDHGRQMRVSDRNTQGAADTSGAIGSRPVQRGIVNTHPVDHRGTGCAPVPAGFNPHGGRHDQTRRARPPQRASRHRLNRRQHPPVLTMIGIEQRLHSLVVQNNAVSPAHAAAASPAA